ncbi:MAG: hypothetical protein NTZ84_01645 [Candidatus Nealsonbacteria bacterium]|nr:hypothetical protein [Candidatus Nealsonbacteria bacterium]
MEETQSEELKKQQGQKKKELETETPQAEGFPVDDSRDEKKGLLSREEIRTMKKDISLIREAEAQKEKERMISLKVGKGQEGYSSVLQKEDELRKEQERKAREAEKTEEMRRIEEIRRAEEARRMEEKRRIEETKRAEEMRKAREAERLAEIKKAEEARRTQEARRMEEIRKVEELKKTEEARRAEAARKIEEMRRAREEERATEIKRAEEVKKIEEARRAEEIKMTEDAEAITEARRAEEAKLIEETKKLREMELAAEVREAQEIERERETGKVREIERTKELEEIMEEKEEAPVQTPEIFQKISSFKPEGPQFLSSLKKVLIRFAIVAIIIVLEIFAGFLYWYLTISPTEKEQPQIETETMIIPPSLIDVQTTITIEASSSEDAALLLPQFLEKNLETGSFARILIENTGEKKVFELNDFLAAFKISPPAGLLEKLNNGFTLFVHSDNNSGRFGFIARIKENEQENLTNILNYWEPTMEKDFENLFASLGKDKTADNPYFTRTTYRGAVFRYISFPTYNNFGICWSTFNNYFLWTCSGESMMRVIDALSE